VGSSIRQKAGRISQKALNPAKRVRDLRQEKSNLRCLLFQKYRVSGIAPLFAEVYNLEGALREGLTVGAQFFSLI